jgi:SAM-dependent methyltransferase
MFGSWSIKRIAWSLRKVALPIRATDLVLDVGSGSNPHPAADVLLERFLDPKHRYSPMIMDRPTVLADACKMPFRDKAFDFVIAFHVLEHVADPARFLMELKRIGKAGYIETPNAIFERLVPYDVHLLEIMKIDDTLVVHKKTAAKPDRFLNELDLMKHSAKWSRFFYANPKLFHVQYLWQDDIKFKVINPEVSSEWFVDPELVEPHEQAFLTSNRQNGLRSMVLNGLRKWHRARKKAVNLEELLACPECYGSLSVGDDVGKCERCQTSYSMRPVPDFNRPLNPQNNSTDLKLSARC